MPKKSKKSTSKRVPLRRKHKILKKVAEAAKKKRKLMRKDAHAGKAKPKTKDPGIPNDYPFKAQLLREMEMNRERDRLKKERRKLENKQRREEDLQRLQETAETRSRAFDDENNASEDNAGALTNGDADNTKGFYKALNKVVEYVDVLIQVLDARDPLGCRCVDVERLIARKHPNKKMVLLLNKADLVPREVLQKWLKYLRSEFPTLAFKCSTQKQARNLSQKRVAKGAEAKFDAGMESIGAGSLLQLLKNYARNQNLKTAVTVGVIGLPNVGKSSLINSLLRSKSVAVGSTPGVTTSIQEVNLDKHVKLLDCPGIVFSSRSGEVRNALLNAVKVERLEDPREAVYEIVARVGKTQLMKALKIPTFESPDHFLELVAQTRGKLLKGGVSDTKSAAKLILQDWNVGKIPFFTSPPERKGKEHEDVKVVHNWGRDFDVDAIYKDEELSLIAQLESMGTAGSTAWIEAKPSEAASLTGAEERKDGAGAMEEEDDEGESDEGEGMDEDKAVGEDAHGVHKQNKILYSHEGQYNPKLAKSLKKKRKKERKMEMETDEYDFEEDWGMEEN